MIETAKDGAIAEIALRNGPLNLVTRDALRALNAAIDALAKDRDVRCVVLHGGDARAFCAGSDIKEFAHLRGNASEDKILFEDMVLRNLARLPMPTIAAIDGPALGGGLELALACDLRVAAAGVALGLTESRLGGLAANGAVRAARLVGPARAKRLLFMGETIDARIALEWGLVDRVTADATALDAARDWAKVIAARGPISNRLGKMLIEKSLDEALDAALGASTVAQQAIFDSDDLQEGMRAFFAKRSPVFRGS
ncbi:MAG: enoyl-CoA hydratase/isomerase family protein [Alphaproteobacteria bacterium]|nr:enoyl-CoA hydratase/isomerase family protein [Alphaproteobacteria bacterium]